MASRRSVLRATLGLAALLALMAPAGDAVAQMRTSVALELVLALDVSASVDSDEFALQINGIAAAFRHPDIIAAIREAGPGGIAVAILEWSEADSTGVALSFQQLVDARSSRAFAFLATRIRRVADSSYTSIGAGLLASLALLQTNNFAGARRVIVVSGDGRNNRAPWPDQVRPRLAAAGVTVNGLAIETDDDKLAEYYRDNVILGPDAFVERAHDYKDYAEMIHRKLLREILPVVSDLPPATALAAAGDTR